MNEELHVLITVEDTVNRAEVKMAKAMEEVKKLLVPAVSMADIGIPTLRSFIATKHKKSKQAGKDNWKHFLRACKCNYNGDQ